jgi:Uma2 family endonuclease
MLEERLVTAEELLAMGEGRRELIAGRVVEMSAAGCRHGVVAVNIATAVRVFTGKSGRGLVTGAETGFRLARDPDFVRAPDAAFVDAGRIEGLDTRGFLPFAPDLAVEVISPGDSFTEVETKARMWLDHGSRLVWVADPEQRLLYVYHPDGSRAVLAEGDVLDGGDVLPGLALPVADCF